MGCSQSSVGTRTATAGRRTCAAGHLPADISQNDHLASSLHYKDPESSAHSSEPPSAPSFFREHAHPHVSPGEQWRMLMEAHRPTVDRRRSMEELYEDMTRLGLQSPKVVFGIDFTKSNEWTGKFSFDRRNLHHIGESRNPYEQVISCVGRSLPSSQEKNSVFCYGFGDDTTKDKEVFNLDAHGGAFGCVDDVLCRYRYLVPGIKLDGPTSFAPIVEMAMTRVMQSGRQYHVLFIIADGQITRSEEAKADELNYIERDTIGAVIRASEYPLSIFLVGVGDGPWNSRTVGLYEKYIVHCKFDNFKFINFTKIMSTRDPPIIKEMDFNLIIWETMCNHYRRILELGLLRNYPATKLPARSPVPLITHETFCAPLDHTLCTICCSNVKDMAFGCGHRTCCDCGMKLEDCPMCRANIQTRIKIYV